MPTEQTRIHPLTGGPIDRCPRCGGTVRRPRLVDEMPPFTRPPDYPGDECSHLFHRRREPEGLGR